MGPIQMLLVICAFSAAFLAVQALGRWWGLIKARHPDTFAVDSSAGAASEDPLLRRWEAVVSMAARELPGRSFGSKSSGTLDLGTLRDQIRLELSRAGEPGSPTDADRFLARALLEGVGLAVFLSLLLSLTSGGSMALVGLAGGALHTFGLRPQLLRSRALERLGRISRRLPYAVDLAALVLGAGGTPREALELVARQKDDPLAEEFSRALAEMQSGSPQSKALTDMAERLQLEDLSILVVAVNRGEATGAPMAKALETQAEVFRFRRLQRAERLAVEAPVKMMFPNMLIMMSVLLLVLGPILVKLLQGGLF